MSVRRPFLAGLAVAAAVALALAAGAAPATAAFRAVEMTLAVEVTGIHVLDWRVQTPGYGDPRRGWSVERGTRTYGFAHHRPVRFDATAYFGRGPGGLELPPLTLMPRDAERAPRGSVQHRVTTTTNHVPLCGGELGDCTGTEPAGVKTRTRSCGPRRGAQQIALDVTAPSGRPDERELYVQLPSSTTATTACSPEPGRTVDDSTPPTSFFLPGGVRRIRALRPGGRVTLRHEAEEGWSSAWRSLADRPVCPSLTGEGSQRCQLDDITVEVTRVRRRTTAPPRSAEQPPASRQPTARADRPRTAQSVGL